MKFPRIKFTKDSLATLLLLLPALVLVGFFVYFAISWNVVVSVSNWKDYSLVVDYSFGGFRQYEKLFADPIFLTSLKNNLILIAIFVPGTLLVGLFLALLLDQKIRKEGVFRTIYLLPFTLSFVVTAFLWRWMFNLDNGVLNYFLGFFNLTSDWIINPDIALYCVVIPLIWQFSGYTMLIILAGIKSIPVSHIMAAEVDGASGFYLYRRVIIPQLKTSIATAFVILIIFALKAFDFIWILTTGGPGTATYILPLYMFRSSFMDTKFAYGSAIATILLLLVMMIVVPYLYKTYRGKEK
ncbi:MAG: sugar-binding transport system permease [Promethearchaeota archaeon CR_4]|nr:MAG: sugar-binding transport system permease [Candidatus Lokiarchaeota archaeon CR_4]